MVDLLFAGQTINLPRNSGLLDTNVLVAFADERDGFHEQALLVIDSNDEYEWLVSVPVVVEACGLLGSRRGTPHVLTLLQWLLGPNNVTLLPGSHPSVEAQPCLRSQAQWMNKYRVDFVDAHLMDLAHTITSLFDLRPHMPIFTFDTADFLRCASNGRRYSLYDMRELELVDFDFS